MAEGESDIIKFGFKREEHRLTNASTRTNLRGTPSVLKEPSTEGVPLRLAGYAGVSTEKFSKRNLLKNISLHQACFLVFFKMKSIIKVRGNLIGRAWMREIAKLGMALE